MSKPVVLDAAARADLKEAELFYENRDPSLGRRFHDAFVTTVSKIEANPHAASLLPGPTKGLVVRGARIWRFPFRVVYVELSDVSRVVAVAHMKRRPGYWGDRLPTPDATG